MRTVTFADPKVVDLLNEKYVVAWNNHSLDRTARGQQAVYTREEMAAYPEGGGGSNLYTVVAAPDGTVINTLTGYWSARTLLGELEFCRTVTPENRVERQAARRNALVQEAAKLENENPQEARKRPRDSALVRRMAALNLLALCHNPDGIAVAKGIDEWITAVAERSQKRVFV